MEKILKEEITRNMLIANMQKEFLVGMKRTQKYRDAYGDSEQLQEIIPKEEFGLFLYLSKNVPRKFWYGILEEIGKPASLLMEKFDEYSLSVVTCSAPAFISGALVVPTDNLNNHNYTIGVTYRVRDKTGLAHCEGSDGWCGNSLNMEKRAVRPATDEEIAIFITKKYASSLINELTDEKELAASILEPKNYLYELYSKEIKIQKS